MGFKENLKSELVYSGMMVKELAAATGIKRHTLDNYLNTHNAVPNAEAAVKIAGALGISVEYLITGRDAARPQTPPPLPPDLRLLLGIAEELSPCGRRLAVKLLKSLREQEHEDEDKAEKALLSAISSPERQEN
jgi:transcriptional regulator with XRE-family HTH domain